MTAPIRGRARVSFFLSLHLRSLPLHLSHAFLCLSSCTCLMQDMWVGGGGECSRSLCLLFLMFAVTPLTMLFRLCLFLVYLSDGWGGVGWGGVGWGVGGMFTFAVTPLTMLFRLCLFLVYLSDGWGGVGWGGVGWGGVGWGVGGMFTFAVTPLTMLFRLRLLFLMLLGCGADNAQSHCGKLWEKSAEKKALETSGAPAKS